jgi:archaellum component FlaF (FlaF/FlaG flagellin family)
LKESFVIEDVWFYNSPKYVNITVRNVGSIDMEVVAIYMNGTTVWDGSQVIDVGETATIKVIFAWDSGEYRIIVATARGNQAREWYSTSG